jgi:hypothetical protein
MPLHRPPRPSRTVHRVVAPHGAFRARRSAAGQAPLSPVLGPRAASALFTPHPTIVGNARGRLRRTCVASAGPSVRAGRRLSVTTAAPPADSWSLPGDNATGSEPAGAGVGSNRRLAGHDIRQIPTTWRPRGSRSDRDSSRGSGRGGPRKATSPRVRPGLRRVSRAPVRRALGQPGHRAGRGAESVGRPAHPRPRRPPPTSSSRTRRRSLGRTGRRRTS